MIKVPRILIMHISRTNSVGIKLDNNVHLPTDPVNFGKYISNLDATIKTKSNESLYELRATTNNVSLGENSTHYTSYVKGSPTADGNVYVYFLNVLMKSKKMN